MLACGYRLEAPLLAIEKCHDGRATLRLLNPGTDLLIPLTRKDLNGMVEIKLGERRLEVFQADLEDRATRFTLDTPMAF